MAEQITKPTKEQYGWVEQSGFDEEPSGWVIEGGEEAYEEALKQYESTGIDRNPTVLSGVSLAQYKRALRKEQLYYPALKFQNIREDLIEHCWRLGMSPTDACNDILTDM